MKPITPHDPLDDLIAAALHGELTPEERTQFESRLANDPAALAAYQEAQAMHDLLEKTHQTAQPNADFEQRMVFGVRRKLQNEDHRETAWKSVVVLWKAVRRAFSLRFLWVYSGVCSLVLVCALAFVIYSGNQVKGVFTTISSQLALAGSSGYSGTNLQNRRIDNNGYVTFEGMTQRQEIMDSSSKLLPQAGNLRVDNFNVSGADEKKTLEPISHGWFESRAPLPDANNFNINSGKTISAGTLTAGQTEATPQGVTIRGGVFLPPKLALANGTVSGTLQSPTETSGKSNPDSLVTILHATKRGSGFALESPDTPTASSSVPMSTVVTRSGEQSNAEAVTIFGLPLKSPATSPAALTDNASLADKGKTTPSNDSTPATDDRKLIRNAQLDLEVKSYQDAMDRITALTKSAGGYVDTSNSQRGGNGKLQGTVVVKVLPRNLDDFLLKLRDLGEVKNQSVSTDDVTKDYFDTQARLVNSQKMEVQLQDLLKRENGKVSDLLAVERELARVRGDIEQMQGQLKLYDFQVQYATVTMQLAEKDLKQTAAYLLKEQDDFSLFATDVEATFQKSRQAAEDFKAQVLVANLNHNSGTDVSALLVVSVPPDQIEPFLAEIRSLGRVANFTRNTKRVAQDGGDANQPADATLTEKDKVMVNVSIRSDDETRKQVALTVVAKAVDDALDQAKSAALAQAGAAILGSSLNKTPQGQSTAQLAVRVPGKEYVALMDAFRALGRTDSLSIQRNDDSGPGANGDDAPVIVSLSLTDDDTPIQTTEMSVIGSDIDNQSQQIKKDAATAGAEVNASSFQRQPDGTELAQMTFRLPMSKYAGFIESLNKLGKVESLSVQRDDRPDETRIDDTAPAEINLQLHNQRGIVADDSGLGATLRLTFGDGAEALFGSVRVIGVLIAFVLPWAFTLGLLAWVGRRIYIWRKR